jgi:hypothetical protein
MNAPLHLEVLLGRTSEQSALPFASEGVLRYVWSSRWGEMLIEVVDGVSYVNGQKVEPAPVGAFTSSKRSPP